MTVHPLHQQTLAPELGADLALKACLPTCFYMLGRAYGYLEGVDFFDFSRQLDWTHSYQEGVGWIRAYLSQELRQRYGMSVVSWQLGRRTATLESLSHMVTAGYVSSPREISCFRHEIAASRSLAEIVSSGSPVIVTMKPGFAYNQGVHAVIIKSWNRDRVDIIDPDARNSRTRYLASEILESISRQGAGSILLPPR